MGTFGLGLQEPIMPNTCPCGTHNSLLLVFFSLAILSLVITKCQARQIREDLAEVEAAMNAFSHFPPRSFKLHMPVGQKRNNKELEIDDEDDGEYEDFPEEPALLQSAYWAPGGIKQDGEGQGLIYQAPSKRYLGIEIPDYVSSPSKGSILKTIQNRMKAAGKK